nr:right-handed parallel beta-helix repeat-containing protein [Fretibacterium sp.]
DRAKTILDFGGDKGIFYIRNKVGISGLTFRNSECGIFIEDSQTATVENCTFKDNITNSADIGSDITVGKNGTVTVKGCEFAGNKSATTGRAISSRGVLTCINCDFTNNISGAIEASSGSLKATNCTFKDNTAANGSAISALSDLTELVLEGCSFTNNTATSEKGGALKLDATSSGADILLTNCDFKENRVTSSSSSAGGGAVCVWNGHITARDCTFADNQITHGGNGGAIYQNGDITLINCVFTGNNAGNRSSGSSRGGAIYIAGGENKMVHCTFAENLAQEGRELSVHIANGKTAVMVNSILYNSDSNASIYTGEGDWVYLKLDNCATPSDVLNHKGVDNIDCKIISDWAPETVTFTRENGHEATVVQSVGILLEGSAELTGKALSSVASQYGVTQDTIKNDMTGRTRDVSAPELGAVNSGKMSPTDPPTIVSFDVEGLKKGDTMVLGRTYTARAEASGEEISWSVSGSDSLTLTDPEPGTGNSTTFNITPIERASEATVILEARNKKGSRKKSLTFAIQTAQEAASSDVTQLIDGETKGKIAQVIGNTFGTYPLMTMQDMSKYISDGGYVQEGIVPDSDAFKTLTSGGGSLAAKLPAFRLTGLSTPVVLLLRVAGLTVSNRTLHLYKMNGSPVAGTSAVQVAAVDLSEDKDARFFDGDTRVTTVTSTDLYVAALYTNGTYAPVVTTSPASQSSGHGGGGCDAGLNGLAVLLMAFPLFRRGKR